MFRFISMIFMAFCVFFTSLSMEDNRLEKLTREVAILKQQLDNERVMKKEMLSAIIAQQMFKNIKDVLSTEKIAQINSYVWNTSVYSKFILALRYLGGANTFLESDSSAFMTSNAKYLGSFWEKNPMLVVASVSEAVISTKIPSVELESVVARSAFSDATFGDAIGDIALSNIKVLGNDSFSNGYASMRDFFENNCPNIAYVFAHIAETQIISGGDVVGPQVAENGDIIGGNIRNNNIHYKAAKLLESFFDDGYISDISDLGISELPEEMSIADFEDELMNEVRQIYNFDYKETLQGLFQ